MHYRYAYTLRILLEVEAKIARKPSAKGDHEERHLRQ